MRKTFHNLTSKLALCVMAIILVMPHSVHSELVLCIGQDGHLEIEFAEAGKCVDCLVSDEHHSSSTRGIGLSTDHCGTCNDIRLANQDIQARQGSVFSSFVKISSVPPVKMAVPIWHERPFFIEHKWFQTRGAPVTTFLRTVRLII